MSEEEKQLAPKGDEGLGFEGMEGTDFALPFLVICQANSPYLNPQHEKFIDGARQGMIINTMNNNCYESIKVIPCRYTFRAVEWKARQTGGGFVSSYTRDNMPEDAVVDQLTGKTLRKSNGNELASTGYYLCMLMEEDWEKVIIPMYSTQLKKSRKWNTLASSLRVNGAPMPLFNKLYELSTVGESNAKGNWFGWKVEFGDDATIYQLSPELYNKAKETYTTIQNFLPERVVQQIAQHSAQESDVL